MLSGEKVRMRWHSLGLATLAEHVIATGNLIVEPVPSATEYEM